MEKFLAGVVGVVEANSFEKLMLQVENERQMSPRCWKANLSGLGHTVGHLGDMPVVISLFVDEVDYRKLLFWHATSEVVDYRMIDKWLEENLPKSAFRENGLLNKVDAQNFHNVFENNSVAA